MTICQTFYGKLYEQTTPDQLTTLTSSPDKEEIPPFLEEEVKETLDEMKKKKAPGNDGITSDVMKIGRPQVIKYMKKVYNEVLKSEEIPICWKEAKIITIHEKGDPKDFKKLPSNKSAIKFMQNIHKIPTKKNGKNSR
ncbi:RNA-directed DNA polymerase from mobile element jockey [Plakobranchus ocellatus]|uniref:RNA-directed DNA polymerase from mobile element jockey n=1 Tax=Plakobranchus ocellatus TaxID=259542 RepID=A0AAV4DY18_9GAST|nr:RNA-directed DNA polymerase from mobile element jockey [Plakobranchus ocellatus]